MRHSTSTGNDPQIFGPGASVLRQKLAELLSAWVMAGRGRPVAELVLSDKDRDTPQLWALRAKPSQALAQRCRIVLGCATIPVKIRSS
jgi:hypothetical protein